MTPNCGQSVLARTTFKHHLKFLRGQSLVIGQKVRSPTVHIVVCVAVSVVVVVVVHS